MPRARKGTASRKGGQRRGGGEWGAPGRLAHCRRGALRAPSVVRPRVLEEGLLLVSLEPPPAPSRRPARVRQSAATWTDARLALGLRRPGSSSTSAPLCRASPPAGARGSRLAEFWSGLAGADSMQPAPAGAGAPEPRRPERLVIGAGQGGRVSRCRCRCRRATCACPPCRHLSAGSDPASAPRGVRGWR